MKIGTVAFNSFLVFITNKLTASLLLPAEYVHSTKVADGFNGASCRHAVVYGFFV